VLVALKVSGNRNYFGFVTNVREFNDISFQDHDGKNTLVVSDGAPVLAFYTDTYSRYSDQAVGCHNNTE
jgi:hypothetical protein